MEVPMGLFDSLAGALGGAGIEGALESVGGLNGLVGKFQQGGLQDVVQSWISTGGNLPINADQIQSVLGSGVIGDLAGKLGLDPAQAADQLAGMLPDLVDKLTPNGALPEGGIGGLLGGLGGMLKG